jgi:hypothetical protein
MSKFFTQSDVLDMIGIDRPLSEQEMDALHAALLGVQWWANGHLLAEAIADLLGMGETEEMSALIRLLRSNDPVPPVVRELLANALAGDRLHYRLKVVRKRKGRSKTIAQAFNARLAEYYFGREVENRMKDGRGYESAIAQVCGEVGMDLKQGRSRMAAWYSAWKRDWTDDERAGMSESLDILMSTWTMPESKN